MKKHTIKYDTKAKALYVKIRKDKINRTIEEVPGVFLDYSRKGKIVGIEVLGELNMGV